MNYIKEKVYPTNIVAFEATCSDYMLNCVMKLM